MTSSFDYSNFATNKDDFETKLDLFKSIYENYDITSDSSYVILSNIEHSAFGTMTVSGGINSDEDCKAYCSQLDDDCIAYSLVDDTSCNIYSEFSIPDSNLQGDDNISIFKNAENLAQLANRLKNQNGDFIGIANNIESDIQNFNNDIDNNYYYDELNGEKSILDASYNALQETKETKRNLIASQDAQTDPLIVNTSYFRYMFLFALTWLLLISFIYSMVNNNPTGSNTMFYLVLLLIVFAIFTIYLIK